jgi:hypothetical protein
MPPIPEWITEATVRRRLWSLAKFKRTDIKLGLSIRQLIDKLVTAHSKNWYDDKLSVNSEGARIIEWAPLLKNVCRFQPDIWSSEPIEPTKSNASPSPPGAAGYGEKDHLVPRRLSDSAVQGALRAMVKQHQDRGTRPTRKEQLAEVRGACPGLSEDRFDALKIGIVPPEWTRAGRPRKSR